MRMNDKICLCSMFIKRADLARILGSEINSSSSLGWGSMIKLTYD